MNIISGIGVCQHYLLPVFNKEHCRHAQDLYFASGCVWVMGIADVTFCRLKGAPKETFLLKNGFGCFMLNNFRLKLLVHFHPSEYKLY